MADEFGAFKQKMHGALDEAFEQRRVAHVEACSRVQRAQGQAEEATKAAKQELEAVTQAIATARAQHTTLVEQNAAEQAKNDALVEQNAAAERKLRTVQAAHGELVRNMAAVANA